MLVSFDCAFFPVGTSKNLSFSSLRGATRRSNLGFPRAKAFLDYFATLAMTVNRCALSIKEGKGGAGQQVSGGCQGARRKKSDRRSSPAGAAFFVRGEAYPLMSPRNLLGGSLFLTLRTWLPPTHFSFCVKGFATPVRKKSSSVQPLPRPHLAVFFPPRPLTQKETCPTPPRSFPSPVLEMNSLGGFVHGLRSAVEHAIDL